MSALGDCWHLGFPAYLIADGEYDDIEVGQTLDTFALEFWCERRLKPATTEERSANPLSDYRYRVSAEVRHLSGTAAVIDFGIQTVGYANLLPKNAEVGDFVTGEIYLGVPISIQMVSDKVLKSLPNKWRVDGISADITPFKKRRGLLRGREYLSRDESHIRFEEVASTKVIDAPSYILHCVKLD